jgi:hypothetical protein
MFSNKFIELVTIISRFNITDDIKHRASKGLLTTIEQQKMREEMLWYRKHLMTPRKILEDLLLENNRINMRNIL